MGILGLVVIGIIGIFLLAGIYKGFLWNLATLGAMIVSVILAALFMGSVSKAIEKNNTLYDAMLSYTEGAEAIYDVELVDRDIASLSNSEIDEIMERSNLHFPLRERVYENIMNEALKSRGATTLGEYFNESIVLVIINILAFLLVYFVSRVALTFLISWLDYSFKFPQLRHFDPVFGGAIGVIRGIIELLIVFMITPIVLTVLPFDQIEELFSASAVATYFHRSNILLKLIPGV